MNVTAVAEQVVGVNADWTAARVGAGLTMLIFVLSAVFISTAVESPILLSIYAANAGTVVPVKET